MSGLKAQRILLGVTAGIAAYKSADLIRRLRQAGAEVQVVMTEGARSFITPLTLQALSGHPVRSALMDEAAEAAMGHIELARWADRVLVAPATADFIARLAHGLADDLLTTLCLATEAPLLLAPAMNRIMWQAPATRENVAVLARRGVRILGPGMGDQACGETGEGRMLEPAELVSALDPGQEGKLAGARVMITAGPTREPIDPVRFVTNRSSGRMGFAVAAAAAAAGAEVMLVAGPVHLPTPAAVRRIDVETAGEMYEAVLSRAGQCDIFIATAAVADYRPIDVQTSKMKKHEQALRLEMRRNPDILTAVASAANAPFTVGFAAETDDVERYAQEKRQAKGIDMIAANAVGAGLGFDVGDNALRVFWEGGGRELPRQPKATLAEGLIDLVAERYRLWKEKK